MLADAVRRLDASAYQIQMGFSRRKNVAFAGAELSVGPLSEAVLNAGETCIKCRVTEGTPYNEGKYSIEQFG